MKLEYYEAHPVLRVAVQDLLGGKSIDLLMIERTVNSSVKARFLTECWCSLYRRQQDKKGKGQTAPGKESSWEKRDNRCEAQWDRDERAWQTREEDLACPEYLEQLRTGRIRNSWKILTIKKMWHLSLFLSCCVYVCDFILHHWKYRWRNKNILIPVMYA